jgi:nicotinamide-nucleotide amidase
MERLIAAAKEVAGRLSGRGEAVAAAESSTGGLLSTALLAVPGASAFFLGGAMIYTRTARAALLGISEIDKAGLRLATEGHAVLLAGACASSTQRPGHWAKQARRD